MQDLTAQNPSLAQAGLRCRATSSWDAQLNASADWNIYRIASRSFMWRGVVHHPKFNNRNCRDDQPDSEVDLHGQRVAVETENPGACRQPQPDSEIEPFLGFDEARDRIGCEKVANRENCDDTNCRTGDPRCVPSEIGRESEYPRR